MHRRVQRNGAVGQVHGLPAAAHLGVQRRASARRRRREVGDGVGHAEAGAGADHPDQALGVVRSGTGFRVHYAIADLGAVVVPGAALDTEVRRRGQTVYLPDGAVPLHPPVLCEDAASLLPDGPRAAVLWRIDLDAEGEPVAVDVRRAVVRSPAPSSTTPSVQAAASTPGRSDAGDRRPCRARSGPYAARWRVRRGAIELDAAGAGGGARSRHGWPTTAGGPSRPGAARPSSDWNAEISPAHRAWLPRRGSCSTRGSACSAPCPPPEPGGRDGVARGGSPALGIDWPTGATARRAAVRAGPRDTPHRAGPAAWAATSLLRGAGYTAFDTAAGAPPPADAGHAADRRAVRARHRAAAAAGRPVRHGGVPGPDGRRGGARTGCAPPCPALPETMAASDAVANAVTRACVDRTEAALLVDRVGSDFDAVVLRAATDNGAGEVYVLDPPVIARCAGVRRPGETARVRLEEADPVTGRIAFTVGR